ncbi:hypothetical protein KDI_19370 [Dictyobacter arantiisoli]|uniref:histidine kinase n=1 Tax=Dictyobacter arantiisoli TaxID=2014874 RepID=A0A5A5TBI3_9CHLR|nr:hypothetical protein KDI_19370 [Dictyobacter arantiisoli]
MLRESMAESRRVVGLLRDAPTPLLDNLGANLRSIAENFTERTGIHCNFVEEGSAHMLDEQWQQALLFALRECLTNAHRHGAAHTVTSVLIWSDQNVMLRVEDDGMG